MNKSSKDIVINGTYQHIEGPKYKVKEILPDATGYETSGKIGESVRYEQLEAGTYYPAGTIWIRRVEDFLGNIDTENGSRDIFTFIS